MHVVRKPVGNSVGKALGSSDGSAVVLGTSEGDAEAVGAAEEVGTGELEGKAVLDGAGVSVGVTVVEGISLGVCDGVKVACTVGRNEGCRLEVGDVEGPIGRPVGFDVKDGVAVGLVG